MYMIPINLHLLCDASWCDCDVILILNNTLDDECNEAASEYQAADTNSVRDPPGKGLKRET